MELSIARGKENEAASRHRLRARGVHWGFRAQGLGPEAIILQH